MSGGIITSVAIGVIVVETSVLCYYAMTAEAPPVTADTNEETRLVATGSGGQLARSLVASVDGWLKTSESAEL